MLLDPIGSSGSLGAYLDGLDLRPPEHLCGMDAVPRGVPKRASARFYEGNGATPKSTSNRLHQTTTLRNDDGSMPAGIA